MDFDDGLALVILVIDGMSVRNMKQPTAMASKQSCRWVCSHSLGRNKEPMNQCMDILTNEWIQPERICRHYKLPLIMDFHPLNHRHTSWMKDSTRVSHVAVMDYKQQP